MKLTKPDLLCYALMLVGVIGWIIAGREAYSTRKYSEVTLNLEKKDVEKATEFCKQLKSQAGVTVGQIAVFDTDGAHYSLPCKALIR